MGRLSSARPARPWTRPVMGVGGGIGSSVMLYVGLAYAGYLVKDD